MKIDNIKEQNHRYSLDIPDKVYTALKIKAAIEKTTVREIILSSLNNSLGKDFLASSINEQKEMLAFTNMSAKNFAKEWDSEDDDKAFSHLQRYKK